MALGSMHSSMARCSQSQPAAPTDEIDANGRTKRAASRVKGACAARTDKRRTTRRYPRPEHSAHDHASGAHAELLREEASKPVKILGTGAGAVKR